MGLSSILSPQVDAGVRNRGREYFASGAVRIVRSDAKTVEAEVRGTQRYAVSLRLRGNDLQEFCSCPYFLDNGATCKHIWATILVAEMRGLLPAAGRNRALELVEDEESLAYVDGESFDEDYDDDDDDIAPRAVPVRPLLSRLASRASVPRAKRTGWKHHLAELQADEPVQTYRRQEPWPSGREILYIVDRAATLQGDGLVLEVAQRSRKKDGTWTKLKSQRIPHDQIAQLPNADDRRILTLLGGAREQSGYWSGSYGFGYYGSTAAPRYVLPEPIQEELVPIMARTGRLQLRLAKDDTDLREIQWDDGSPWQLRLRVEKSDDNKKYLLRGELRRGEEERSLTVPTLLTAGGLVFWEDRVARLQDAGAFDWVPLLRREGALVVPLGQADEFLTHLLNLPQLPPLDLPPDLRFDEVAVAPQPRLRVRPPQNIHHHRDWLRADLSFAYDGVVVPAQKTGRAVYQSEQRRLLLRDPAVEAASKALLHQLKFQPTRDYSGKDEMILAPRNLPRVVPQLLAAGWHVEADGKLYRQAGEFRIEVTTGVDWFDLHASVDFGETTASLPRLLAALKKGENVVRLDDGTFGLLPEEWLRKYGILAGLGTVTGDELRFRKNQVGLLDALLAAQPEVTVDKQFAQARRELQSFAGIEPADAPAGFVGELRGYQREGLGWLTFLQRFGFGGCLADDMGLGKTVMVLALLETRRELRQKNGKDRPAPTLVVVPRSLVFNWVQEATRFAPQLRVLDHTGIGRTPPGEHFNEYDLVLTTYGTLRRDAHAFKDLEFDYAILDEAQAIKNANTESSKAARLLQARHRLALSGTPIENHLGELFSLFDFLNPGMLGSAAAFAVDGGLRNPAEESRRLLAQGLRPFILRRTKEQVAKDLPTKTEQTIWCDLEPEQRKLYNELRDHYRQSLLSRVERDGLNKSKIQVLEALLRLRQAACHPGLVDKKRVGEPSAKLDQLLAQLEEVRDEGHKALVFSQFTSLLAIVRERLDRDSISYVYLDGRTRDREARVRQFQEDPESRLFLISLKAGGLGLNLTAAEYVFLLDPWWNPAVESQAIDRAHRIGQTRPVFAYRLIARDTVEEKVVELQQQKRDLADAIINADNSLIRTLTREDLERLLS